MNRILATGSTSAIVDQPLPHEEPRQRQPDIGKAQAILDLHPPSN